jgi:hypothetical protein
MLSCESPHPSFSLNGGNQHQEMGHSQHIGLGD